MPANPEGDFRAQDELYGGTVDRRQEVRSYTRRLRFLGPPSRCRFLRQGQPSPARSTFGSKIPLMCTPGYRWSGLRFSYGHTALAEAADLASCIATT
jgi:hypothetical protein